MKATKNGFNPEFSEDAPTFEELSNLQSYAIVEFGAPWCSHCQAAQPAVETVLAEHTKLPHVKLYDGKGKRLGRAFNVKLWPTFVLLHDGKEVDRVVRPNEVDEFRKFVSQVNLKHIPNE